MPRTFHGHGIVLAYPDNWEAEESETDDGWSLLLQSPGSAFVQLIGQTRGKGTDAMAACAAASVAMVTKAKPRMRPVSRSIGR